MFVLSTRRSNLVSAECLQTQGRESLGVESSTFRGRTPDISRAVVEGEDSAIKAARAMLNEVDDDDDDMERKSGMCTKK